MHRALVRTADGTIVVDRPTESPGPGEILVAPQVVGVCGTDLQILAGVRPDAAAILGHEGVARVIATGAGVEGVETGALLVFNPVNPRNQNEILGHSIDGLFQRRRLVTAEEWAWGLAEAAPSAIDPTLSTLIEPLAAALYGFELVEIVIAPESVLVVGAGPIGLLTAIAAQARGAKRIRLVTNSARRRDWAVVKGVLPEEDILLADDYGETKITNDLHEGADAIFMCTPRRAACAMLEAVLPWLVEGGCVDLLGGFADGDEVAALPGCDLNSVRRANICGIPSPGRVSEQRTRDGGRVLLTGHRGTHPRHLARAQAALSADSERFGVVITHRSSLEAAPALLALLATRGAGSGAELVKGVVDLRLDGHILEPIDGSGLRD